MVKQIKGYTTEVPAAKTVLEIEYMLSQFGASAVWKDYTNGRPISINFVIETRHGPAPFKLPMNAEKVRQVMIKQKEEGRLRSISMKQAEDLNHATNVGWRVVRDWIDSQLSLLDIELVQLEQVMLPYLYNPDTKKTLYETLEEKKFSFLLEE